jgi:hypothetical protein
MIQADVYKVLSEDAGIINIAAARIYPIRLPADAPVPAVVYTIDDISPEKSMDGETGLDRVIIEITCWAKAYLTAHSLADAVRTAFGSAGIGVMTGTLQDTEDEETRNYGVVMKLAAWSTGNKWNVNTAQTAYTDIVLKAGKKLIFDGA